MNLKIASHYLLVLLILIGLAALGIYRSGQLDHIVMLAVVSALWLGCVWIALKKPQWSWFAVLLFLLSWGIFPLMTYIVKYVYQWSADELLHSIDQQIWGGKILPAYFHYEAHPIFSDLISACYFMFYFLVLGSVIYFALKMKQAVGQVFFNGLILLYLLGFIGYLLLPAAGPAFTVLPQQGGGGALTQMITTTVNAGVTGMDVFPSLHTAISIYIVGYLWHSGLRKLSLALLPIIMGTIFATVFLRYHYGIDVLLGMAIGFYVLKRSHADLAEYREQSLASASLAKPPFL
ncbi:PAP2 superfamily protein [Acinetobacter calcoaceticus]|uniref:PAP2 superfamily protein n=1 Tax=Acinetobacter calcoaceticus TaxID=471 RepID=A0A4R1XCI9_ACICA|nr:PAP2 superfamily protein [Acinetobacter calcoaceticus]